MTGKRWAVLSRLYPTGWANLWSEGDQPKTYASRQEAQAALDANLADDVATFGPDHDTPEDYEIRLCETLETEAAPCPAR